MEQLQRERQAELAASEATLAMLKDQVTGVLNRYLSKDIELQVALQEMQALGIELVPLGAQDGRCVVALLLHGNHGYAHHIHGAFAKRMLHALELEVRAEGLPLRLAGATDSGNDCAAAGVRMWWSSR